MAHASDLTLIQDATGSLPASFSQKWLPILTEHQAATGETLWIRVLTDSKLLEDPEAYVEQELGDEREIQEQSLLVWVVPSERKWGVFPGIRLEGRISAAQGAMRSIPVVEFLDEKLRSLLSTLSTPLALPDSPGLQAPSSTELSMNFPDRPKGWMRVVMIVLGIFSIAGFLLVAWRIRGGEIRVETQHQSSGPTALHDALRLHLIPLEDKLGRKVAVLLTHYPAEVFLKLRLKREWRRQENAGLLLYVNLKKDLLVHEIHPSTNALLPAGVLDETLQNLRWDMHSTHPLRAVTLFIKTLTYLVPTDHAKNNSHSRP